MEIVTVVYKNEKKEIKKVIINILLDDFPSDSSF